MAVAAKAKPAAARSAAPAATVGREAPQARMEHTSPTAPSLRQVTGHDGKIVHVLDGPIVNRSGQAVGLRFTGAEDKFDFDRSIIPPGYDYQWKAMTCKGAPMHEHQVELAQNAWEAVPPQRHDGMFMPKGYPGNTIDRGGQRLMERDMRLTLKARMLDKRAADEPVKNALSQAGLAGMMQNAAPNSGAIVDFDSPDARGANYVRKQHEGTIVNPQRNYTYTLDEG